MAAETTAGVWCLFDAGCECRNGSGQDIACGRRGGADTCRSILLLRHIRSLSASLPLRHLHSLRSCSSKDNHSQTPLYQLSEIQYIHIPSTTPHLLHSSTPQPQPYEPSHRSMISTRTPVCTLKPYNRPLREGRMPRGSSAASASQSDDLGPGCAVADAVSLASQGWLG